MFGLTRQKPHHYREMLRIVSENRDELLDDRGHDSIEPDYKATVTLAPLPSVGGAAV